MILKMNKMKCKKKNQKKPNQPNKQTKQTKQVTIILSLNNWYTPCKYSLLSENYVCINKHFIAPVKMNIIFIYRCTGKPLNLQHHTCTFLPNTEIYIK